LVWSLRMRGGGEPVRPEELTLEDGRILVWIARKSVELYLEGRRFAPPEDLPEKLMRPGAAFVTIESVVRRGPGEVGYELRGCIGSVRPVEPLAVTVANVAVEAAFADPRFPPLTKEELDKVVFEVTVLGPLEELPRDPRGRAEGIVVGVHGIYIEAPPHAGLLLPQVAVDEGWDPMTFLSWACVKAGLKPTCWYEPWVRVYRFTAKIFREREPRGEVYERNLLEEARRKGLTSGGVSQDSPP